MRLLQLSDPHLVASDAALVRERPALALWNRALEQVALLEPDALVITGDLALGVLCHTSVDTCQPDESLRKSILHDGQSAHTVNVNHGLDVHTQHRTQHLPHRQEIQDTLMQSIEFAVC